MNDNRFCLDEGVESRMSDLESRMSELEYVFRHGSVRDMERLMIMQRLAQNDQNRTRAAKTLEISVRTIRNKLRLYRDLEPAPEESPSALEHSDA